MGAPTWIGGYRIDGVLGKGATAIVYHALSDDGQPVALKVLRERWRQHTEAVKRLSNEATALSLVAHPNVVRHVAHGKDSDHGHYLAMELIEGRHLATILARDAFLPWLKVAEIVDQASAALGASHAAGVIHRDVKPANLLVFDPQDGSNIRVCLIDFGSARIERRALSKAALVTLQGVVIGTPNYMSPEHCRDATMVDARSDIYSLGVLAYELICGQRPFISKRDAPIFAMHLAKEPPALREFNPMLPAAAERVVLKALSKRPDQRFNSVETFGWALRRALLGDTSLPPPPVRTIPPAAHPAQPPVFNHGEVEFGHTEEE
ncbi:MAG: serine/threonine protein kinase [Deltaproteobacteria bacterium]|nr:serine/threonine protein kinase [Deltaproteobacteria bacterium]